MILIAYDGSADAQVAIGRAGQLFPGQSATVLAVWQPFVQLAARTSVGFAVTPAIPDAEEIDQATEQRAQELAQEGVELATGAGLDAQPRTCSQLTTTGRAILAEADGLDADAIVLGSRGLTGLKSLLLGSVSHEVIHHADRTVVIVPSPEVAASRAGHAHQETAS